MKIEEEVKGISLKCLLFKDIYERMTIGDWIKLWDTGILVVDFGIDEENGVIIKYNLKREDNYEGSPRFVLEIEFQFLD